MPFDLIFCIALAATAAFARIYLRATRKTQRDKEKILLVTGAVFVGLLSGLLGIEKVRLAAPFPVFVLVVAALAWWLRKPKKREGGRNGAAAQEPAERHDYTDMD